LRARTFVATNEGGDGLFMRTGCFQRLRDRSIRGKLSGIDAALKFGKRDHGRRSCAQADLRSGSGRGKSSLMLLGCATLRSII
jgi:hypothetical protein